MTVSLMGAVVGEKGSMVEGLMAAKRKLGLSVCGLCLNLSLYLCGGFLGFGCCLLDMNSSLGCSLLG